MTVLRERDFGMMATPPAEPTPEPLAAAVEEEAPAKPKRTRKKTEDTK
jgi:hypothetical protein